MQNVEYSMWNALMQYRDFIVDKCIDVWRKGGDYEALMDKMCKDSNIEYFLVRDHFNECVRILSLETVTVK